MKLIASIHKNVMLNVEQAQQKQKKTYAPRRGKQTFERLIGGQIMVKMKKLGKKKALTSSQEGPYQFVTHVDGLGNLHFEEDSKLCIIQDANGNQWERSHRDLHIYHALHDNRS